jgi:Fe2+ transport system protein FeoA
MNSDVIHARPLRAIGRASQNKKSLSWILRENVSIRQSADSKMNASCNPVSIDLCSAHVNEMVQKHIAQNPPQPLLYPLSDVRAGVSVRIRQVSASPEVTSRLREMGFCEDQKIRVVSRHSNLICQVCHARIGLNPKLAEKILVESITGKQAA